VYEVSVIIPAYNRAGLIGETLASVLAQTHPPAEILVVDDGSTDNTADVVRGFAPRVRYLKIDNSGPSIARNAGVAATRMPWIAFCDSDDLWRPDRLARQLELLEREPELDYIFTNFVHIVDGHWQSSSKFDQAPAEFWSGIRNEVAPGLWVLNQPLYGRLLRFQPIFPSTVLMSRAFFERVGRCNPAFSRTISEDWEFTLRCASEAPLGVVADPVVGIRKHAENYSGNVLRCLLGELEILRHAAARHSAAAPFLDVIQDEMARRSAEAADIAFAVGDFTLLRRLAENVPLSKRTWKLRVKHWVASMPAWVAKPAHRALLRLSDLRTHG